MTTFNSDGYESALIGTRRYGNAVPTHDAMLRYESGGLYARIVDLPCDKAVARGVIVMADDVPEEAVQAELDRLKVMPILADALRVAKLTGGAGIALLADDAAINQPLDANNLNRIEELRVFSLRDLSADDATYNDPTQANYGMPTHYRVTVGAKTFRIHESRLVEISGGRTFNRQPIPWAGKPDVTRAYAALSRYNDTLELGRAVMERKQQPVYQMEGLAELIQAKLEPLVQKRINLVDSVRGILNTVAVDAKDAYTVLDLNLSGIPDVIHEMQVSVSAETGVPVTILFGRSPGGLNATGESDFESYHEMIEGYQTLKLTPALERLISLIYAQKAFEGNAPENWSIEWPALATPTDAEAAAVRKTTADAAKAEMEALAGAMDVGGLSEEEARAYMESEGLYGLSVTVGNTGAGNYGNQT